MRWIKKIYKLLLACFNLIKFIFLDLNKIKNAEIVFFFPFYHTGGAEKVHANIINAVKEKKCTVIFTKGSATKSMFQYFEGICEIIELNLILNKKQNWISNTLEKSIIASINQSKSLKSIFCCNSEYFYQFMPKLDPSIKINDLFHNFFENDSREQSVVNSVEYITNRIVINEAAKKDLMKIYEKNRIPTSFQKNIKIISNGIKLAKSSTINKDKANIKIGYIGRWCFEKRPELFLSIAKKVRSNYPSVSFIMVGPGMRSNIDLINNAGVEFLGEITNEQSLNKLYNELHFIVLPSIYEGFPMVIMEAMACGVIPITTNLDGICEHIVSSYNGILIDQLTEEKIVEAFYDAITLLLESSDLRNDLSMNCFSYAHEHFGIEKFNKSYQELLS